MGAVVEDAVEAVDSHVDILRSFRVKNGHVVSVPMRRISQQEQQDTMSGSEGFLDQGRHEVFHQFVRPIQREEQYAPVLVEGEDQPDTGGVRGSSSVHFNIPPSRLSSVEHGEVLSPGVVSGNEGVEVINMDEEEQLDEEMRRFHAHKKWNDRRRQIEAEFQRLRHFSIQQQRAGRMRHSVSFGDDLEVQVACGTEFVRTSSNGSKTRNFSTVMSGTESVGRTTGAPFALNRNSVPVMHQLERSRSMPMRQPNEEGYPGRRQPKLETYEEEEEEENDDVFDDNILMGLPPKDIPCRAMSNSTEQLPSLNMDEIPFTDVHNNDQGVASERQHSERSHGSTSSSRRGSDQIEYVGQESTEDDRTAAGRQGSKKKRSQVRQELAKYYNQEDPETGRHPSGKDGEESSC